MLSKEEFDQIVIEEAQIYVSETLLDPEEHGDAAEAIIEDFKAGAELAWQVLTTKE